MGYKFKTEVFKSPREYNPKGLIHGMPYYYIYRVEEKDDQTKVYELHHLDIESETYNLIEINEQFNPLYEKALKLEKQYNQYGLITDKEDCEDI